jgi:hypothetical protein
LSGEVFSYTDTKFEKFITPAIDVMHANFISFYLGDILLLADGLSRVLVLSYIWVGGNL